MNFRLFLWILLLILQRPDAVSSSSPTSSSHHSSASIKAATTTRLTGFASRSKRSIFLNNEKEESATSNPSNTTLWVQKSTRTGALYFQTRVTTENATSADAAQFTNNRTVSVSLQSDGSWSASIVPNADTNEDCQQEPWIPVEGIYGVFGVPSGLLVLLVTRTDTIYENAALDWTVARVRSMEVVHLAHPNLSSLTPRHVKEEARQVRLLRQALKEHTFYSMAQRGNPPGHSSKIPDVTTTHTWQRALSGDKAEVPDERFFWNAPSIEPLQQKHRAWCAAHPSLTVPTDNDRNNQKDSPYHMLLQHVLPLTSAFVGVQHNIPIDSTNFTYDQVLISRRSRFRAGTRFTKRGADGTGNVANYAETEQILVVSRNATTYHRNATTLLLSHVQTRGSIPLRWSSPADVKTYRPRIRIGTDPLAQARAVRRHLQHECNMYALQDRTTSTGNNHTTTTPRLVFVNLIDSKQDQGRLGRAFDAVLQAVLDVYTVNGTHIEEEDVSKNVAWRLAPHAVQHVWFDFHAQVKHGRWDKLGTLVKDLGPTLEHQGYLCCLVKGPHNWTVVRRQDGVVRTNCMDCLDRTNVVQSLFGRYMLFRQLAECGYLVNPKNTSKASRTRSLPLQYSTAFRRNSMVLPWNMGEVAHRHLWADNADAISRLYAGTPALKRDYTRTGKRTKRGALDDGMNSLQRYYLNNFLDADRQEGMDLLVGHAEFSMDDTDAVHAEQEATRAILLGQFDASDERNHVYIHKSPNSLSSRLPAQGGGAAATSRTPLDLRWLPGDLQSHLKSNALGVVTETKDALEAMDHRAKSDLPWWTTVEDSSSSHDEVEEDTPSAPTAVVGTGAGYVIGCLVAALQAPGATAASVVAMLGLASASSLKQDKDS